MSEIDNIKKLSKQLHPTGRAFRISEGSEHEKLEKGILISEDVAYCSATTLLDSLLPDNPNFTEDDATRLELFLGMITTDSTLSERKQAILRKLNHPSDIPARQSADFLQSQLQLAGFDVYIHENPNGLNPSSILQIGLDLGRMGAGRMGVSRMNNVQTYYPGLFQNSRMGVGRMGISRMNQLQFTSLIANYIDETKDESFSIGSTFTHTFVIGGQDFGTYADVPEARKKEFRQIILRLKSTETVGLVLINYI